jgi:hypothetical protein
LIPAESAGCSVNSRCVVTGGHKPLSALTERGAPNELRACTDDVLGTGQSEQYSEQKFLQVERIIDRFKGREGMTDLDRNWTRRVTDVRQWFVFSASERWRVDDREYEHYTDSAGKSGDQRRSWRTRFWPRHWRTSSSWTGGRSAPRRSASW